MVGFIHALICVVSGLTSALGSPLEARGLDKPVVAYGFEPQNPQYSRMMLQQLQKTKPHIVSTNFTVRICYDCQNKFQELGYNVSKKMYLYNVTYADCGEDEPWVMCRHKDANITIDDIANSIGHIPLNMRKYLRHIMTVPDPNTRHPTNAVEIDEGNLIVHGQPTFQSLLAAAARVFADHGFPKFGNANYWESPNWLGAYNKDTALVNSLAKTSQEENLKQMTVVAVYDAQVPELKHIVPEWQKFENMLRQIQKDAISGAMRKTDKTTCAGKVSNERPGGME